MLTIKLVQPVTVPHDFSGGWYKILLLLTWFLLTALFFFQGSGSIWWNILSLLALYAGLDLISKRYGLWVKNYKEKGRVALLPNRIDIITNQGKRQILFSELIDLEFKTNFYQNYREDVQGKTFDGLGTLVLHLGKGEIEVINFLLQNTEEWVKFQSISEHWQIARPLIPTSDQDPILLKVG